MRAHRDQTALLLLAGLACFIPTARVDAQAFDTPLHINMGGPEITDSLGRVWLGDVAEGDNDPLGLRPNDGGGANVLGSGQWCGPQSDEVLEALGFTAGTDDGEILRSIRWDIGGDTIPYTLEIPVDPGAYDVTLYFCESCCANRHSKVLMQETVVFPDVHPGTFAGGAVGVAGALTAKGIYVGESGELDITLLGCLDPECPDGGDPNPILAALSVEPSEVDPCEGGVRICPFNFRCEIDLESDTVKGSWDGPACFEVTGYEVYQNDVLIDTLAANASSFSAVQAEREASYRVVPLVADGEEPCAELSCGIVNRNVTLDTPLYVNSGGPEVVDQFGRTWLGDEGANADPLNLRPNDVGGGNVITAWCPAGADTSTLPGVPPSQVIESIRWDGGADGIDYAFELPLDEGTYDVRFYFCESCCPQRHFKIDVQGETLFPDVHVGSYANGVTGAAGALEAQDIVVGADQILDIRLLPCPDPECPGGTDINAILNGLAILPSDFDECTLPGFGRCPGNLQCSVTGAGEVVASFDAPLCFDVSGYEVFRDGEKVLELPADATGFTDTLAGSRFGRYEVVPLTADGAEGCGAFSCAVECPCPSGLSLAYNEETDEVTGIWTAPGCSGQVESYDVLRNGNLVESLPGDATEFTDTFDTRVGVYEVVPVLAEGLEQCPTLSGTVVDETKDFEVPLRINMGGVSTRDSLGRLWIGDQPSPGDALGIRPDDAGGTNFIQNWCVASSLVNADSLESLGLDAFSATNQRVFNTIRWDVGDDDGDGLAGQRNDPDGGDTDFLIQLPVPNAMYQVNLYFTECCCPNRHFSVELQGQTVAEDVSAAAYSRSGRLGRTGRLSFDDVEVRNGRLQVGLRPCVDPTCPGGTDPNAIIDAIEVLPAGAPFSQCPNDLVVTLNEDGSATGVWTGGTDVSVAGYELYLNFVKVQDLPGDATEFTHEAGCVRVQRYDLLPVHTDESEGLCPRLLMTSAVVNPDCAFDTPLRINMGGPELIDSQGRHWLGDRRIDAPEADDPLLIRPDDAGAARSLINWCPPDADSVDALGFDSTDPADNSILSTIRWDDAASPGDYLLEIPLDEGEYQVDMYFNECCCTNRHFSIAIQGEVVDDDVSYLDYDPVEPALRKPGRLSFEGNLVAETLDILLVGCPAAVCPGGGDINPILNALDITRTGDLPNKRPTAVIVASATEVELRRGEAQVNLDGSQSDDGEGGAQGLTYEWSLAAFELDDVNGDGEPGVTIASPDQAVTDVTFTKAGSFTFQLLVDDGQSIVNIGTASVSIDVLPESGPLFARGDSDSSGEVNLSDGVKVLNFLFLGLEEPECIDAADANDDGSLDLSDAVRIFGWLFLGDPAPPDPTPSATVYVSEDCAIDPTEDPLGCAVTAEKCQ